MYKNYLQLFDFLLCQWLYLVVIVRDHELIAFLLSVLNSLLSTCLRICLPIISLMILFVVVDTSGNIQFFVTAVGGFKA